MYIARLSSLLAPLAMRGIAADRRIPWLRATLSRRPRFGQEG
jgi:hypothetical protein